MRPLVRMIATVAAAVTFSVAAANAQWTGVSRRVPVNAAGAPNMAAPAPKLADRKTPDLSGIWDAEKRSCNEATARLGCIDAQAGVPVGFTNIAGGAEDVLPMHPWAATLVRQRRADGGKNDPFARCLPESPPRAWGNFYLQKLIQTPESITILEEYMLQSRQIFLDGRRLPPDPEPLFKGYSVGHWEGNTLVVQSAGFKDDGWLDLWGHPLTDQGRVTERIRRPTFGTLEVEITVDDPKAYTKPWTATRNLSLVGNGELLEYVCNENEKSLQHMVGADAAAR